MDPLKFYDKETPIDTMEKIEVTLEICTLYKGVPNGLSLIKYTHPNNEYYSFKGIGIFKEGKLDGSPFYFVKKLGKSGLLTKMESGRPANKSYITFFYE